MTSAASTKQRFSLTLRNAPSPMATFPSFELAWANALNMFQDANATICGCHYTPAIGCEPPLAEFMIASGGKVEEYVIHQENLNHALRTSNGYCCLGVLCDLKGVEWVRYEAESEVKFITQDEGAVLPRSVRIWAGLRTNCGVVPALVDTSNDHQLASLNDNGKTFAEIADIIETHWREL